MRSWQGVTTMLSAAAALIFLWQAPAVWADDAAGWWNNQWTYRQEIRFDTTATGADIPESLVEVPMLLRLHTGNFAFTEAMNDGTDLRFVAGQPPVPLKHQIERYDPIDEVAFVWVKIPRLAGASGETAVGMYYGNGAAVAGQDPGGTFDIHHAAVFHLGEAEGPPRDATAFGNHAAEFQGTLGLPSLIGNGAIFNGAGDRLVVADHPSLDFSSGFAFSAWVRVAQPQEDGYLFFRRAGDAGVLVVGIDGTQVFCRVLSGESGAPPIAAAAAEGLTPENWHHLVVTIQPLNRVAIYLDGVEAGAVDFKKEMPATAGDVVIASAPDGAHAYVGEIDEIHVSKIARSAAWAAALYRSQGPEPGLIRVEAPVRGGGSGMPVFYLATVLKNITLDGWVIIGLLILFSVWSWLVFVSKSLSVMLVQRQNRRFAESYRSLDHPMALADGEKEGDAFPNSNLYAIYLAGCREAKRLLGIGPDDGGEVQPSGAPVTALSETGEKSLGAVLEKALVMESKKLNAWLVVLTMAITGGPFLGLLGTVWGVMNTFAAMAEAGEADIMAIAPGVASALSTTVFGLIVAIPALFGYNYLTTRIQSITADMSLFVDELALKLSNADRSPR